METFGEVFRGIFGEVEGPETSRHGLKHVPDNFPSSPLASFLRQLRLWFFCFCFRVVVSVAFFAFRLSSFFNFSHNSVDRNVRGVDLDRLGRRIRVERDGAWGGDDEINP